MHLGCFYFFVTVINAAMNIGVHVFLWLCFISLGYIPRSGNAESYSSSRFNILRNCQNVFQSGATIYTSNV